MELATLGNGCFWCTEAIFQELKGVSKVESGYSGGPEESPTYREVCSGNTGHAEVLQITYDEQVITFEELLEVFWQTHDPTTHNRQGNDIGPQYRSAIFFHSEEQRESALRIKTALGRSGAWSDPVVTEITAFDKFYSAGDYHQNYYKLNGSEPYCNFMIRPKVEKFKEAFGHKLK